MSANRFIISFYLVFFTLPLASAQKFRLGEIVNPPKDSVTKEESRLAETPAADAPKKPTLPEDEAKPNPLTAKKKPAQEKDTTKTLIKKFTRDLAHAKKAKRWDEALVLAGRILALNPENKSISQQIDRLNKRLYSSTIAKARVYQKHKQYNQAILSYKKALQHKKSQSLEARIKSLENKVARQSEKKSQAFYLNALKAHQSGDVPKAVQLCLKALNLDPENHQAQRMLNRLKTRSSR